MASKLVGKRKTVKERRRAVAQSAELKAATVRPVMSRKEIEAYIDGKLEKAFPGDAPVGGAAAQILEAIAGYIKQNGYAPTFCVIPRSLMGSLDQQLEGHPQWGMDGNRKIAGVVVFAGETRGIVLGR